MVVSHLLTVDVQKHTSESATNRLRFEQEKTVIKRSLAWLDSRLGLNDVRDVRPFTLRVWKREKTQRGKNKRHTHTHQAGTVEFSLGCYLVLIMAGDWHFPLSDSTCVCIFVCVCVSGARIDPKDHATSYTLFSLVHKTAEKERTPG